VSLAFIKDIVPFGQAAWVNLLLFSWIAFALCIVITVFSFLVSIAALKEHEDSLRKIYAERKTPPGTPEKFSLLKYCTYGVDFFFVVGLACTMIFVGKNVHSFHASEFKSGKPTETVATTNVRNFYMSDHAKGGRPIEKAVT